MHLQGIGKERAYCQRDVINDRDYWKAGEVMLAMYPHDVGLNALPPAKYSEMFRNRIYL